jgi:hypothetical protein
LIWRRAIEENQRQRGCNSRSRHYRTTAGIEHALDMVGKRSGSSLAGHSGDHLFFLVQTTTHSIVGTQPAPTSRRQGGNMARCQYPLAIGVAMTVVVAGCAAAACATRAADTAVLTEYRQQVQREWPGESHQQALTTDTLRLLAAAIGAVAERRTEAWPELASRLERMRADTEAYRLGQPGTLDQSAALRRIFMNTAGLITELVERAGVAERPVDPRLSALHRAAESLAPDMLLRRQPDTLERFFHHAGEALHRVDHGARVGLS